MLIVSFLTFGCASTDGIESESIGANDVHGTLDQSAAEALGLQLEIEASEDTLDDGAEASPNPPATIQVDVLDAVGAAGVDDRLARVQPLILDFNALAATAAAPKPPAVVIGQLFEYTGARDILYNFHNAVTPGRLTVVLLSHRDMDRVGGVDTCGVRVRSIQSALFVDGAKIFSAVCPRTIPHELGHWLGLHHTFGPSGAATTCTNLDGVDDTPVHLGTGLNTTCDAPLPDSCPAQPGLDPFRNIMSYTGCPREYTPGQMARMASTWARVWRSRGFR